MHIRPVSDEQAWNGLVSGQPYAQFLQSWPWGQFQHDLGHQLERLGLYEGNELTGGVAFIRKQLPFGPQYLYAPRGPIIDQRLAADAQEQSWRTLLGHLIDQGTQVGAMFVKLELPLEEADASRVMPHGYPVREAGFVQPRHSWYLDLRQTEAELLAAMHQKTRYNIRLAEKRGVVIQEADGLENFEQFWQLQRATSERDQFRPHGKVYYQQMFRTLIPTGLLKVFFAYYEGKPIAAIVVTLFGDTATYVHGVSGNAHRNVMAPHLLQWHAIRLAKEQGKQYYDFWGVAPEDAPADHAWQGITRFKKGFGGYGRTFPGARDVVLKPFWYSLYRMYHRVRYRR